MTSVQNTKIQKLYVIKKAIINLAFLRLLCVVPADVTDKSTLSVLVQHLF